jgi:hypothetical protein
MCSMWPWAMRAGWCRCVQRFKTASACAALSRFKCRPAATPSSPPLCQFCSVREHRRRRVAAWRMRGHVEAEERLAQARHTTEASVAPTPRHTRKAQQQRLVERLGHHLVSCSDMQGAPATCMRVQVHQPCRLSFGPRCSELLCCTVYRHAVML